MKRHLAVSIIMLVFGVLTPILAVHYLALAEIIFSASYIMFAITLAKLSDYFICTVFYYFGLGFGATLTLYIHP